MLVSPEQVILDVGYRVMYCKKISTHCVLSPGTQALQGSEKHWWLSYT